ncbi:RNA polymerase sigma factor SigJ [Bremerella sp. JC817]|uniref:RNA polymerase sigma factor SigJ n=1 Tax=Bremerella sp. JC817 TaxID=3231756 RepID=UPI0034593414
MVAANEFESLRQQLIGFSYRMLGSVSDAEDIVQEAYLNWEQAGRPKLDSPRSWFFRVCSRLCLDRIKSAQYQRENYVGPWLPEPLLEDHADRAELDESISMALMLTIERLKPAERAAFILHDLFGYEFNEVASILGLEAANCRQLAKRARTHLKGDKQRAPADAQVVKRISDAFFEAVNEGDLDNLRSILSEDVVLTSDGGGKVSAARRPMVGFDEVTTFMIRVIRNARRNHAVEFRAVRFNGAPGILGYMDGELFAAYQVEVVDGKVQSLYVVRNPDKLAIFSRLATS